MKQSWSPVKYIYTNFFSQEIPLERRVTHAMILCAMLGSFFGFVETFLLQLSSVAILLPLVSFFILFLIFIWGLKTGHAKFFTFLAVSISALVMFPLMFVTNDGLHGGMPYYFLVAVVCIALALRGKTRIILFFVIILEYSGLCILYKFMPQIFVRMTYENAFIDQLCSMLISSLILFSFSYIVSRQNFHDRNTIEQLSKLYERQANTDELTELYNRRYFNNFLKLAITTLGDTGKLHIAMFDIDDFKIVNDKYGHPFGDTVLKQFAKILKKNESAGATVCRYGGEEFLILIPKKDKQEAVRLVEDILEDTRTQIKIGNDGFVTVSAGFITCTDDMTYDVLLQEVDKRLYAAKCAGKNRIVL